MQPSEVTHSPSPPVSQRYRQSQGVPRSPAPVADAPSPPVSRLLELTATAREQASLPMPPLRGVLSRNSSSSATRKGKEKEVKQSDPLTDARSPPPLPPPNPRSRPARPILWFERLLQKRLQVLIQEKDVLGKAVAELYSHLWDKKGAVVKALQGLLPKLLLPSELLAKHRQTLMAQVVPETALKPILELLQELQTVKASSDPGLNVLQTKIGAIITYYESFVAELKGAEPKKRAQLLSPKAQVCGDQIGFRLIDPELARKLLCRDQCGEVVKENAHGIHAVTAVGGIHFKPNLTSPFIAPGQEYAVGTLCQLFSRRKLIAAPTTLIKVRRVPFTALAHKQPDEDAFAAFTRAKRQGTSADNIFVTDPTLRQRLIFNSTQEERVVQGGFTIGYHKGDLPSAASFQTIVEIVDTMEILRQALGEETLINVWTKIRSSCAIIECRISAEQLHGRYFAFMNRFPSNMRCLNFKRPEDLSQEELQKVRCLARWPKERQVEQFQHYLQNNTASDWLSLLSLLEISPKIMQGQRMEKLGEIPRILRSLFKLLPKCSSRHAVKEACHLLDRLDQEALSALCVGSLVTTPTDGKADNYMVDITRDEKGFVASLTIVGIDNDMALEPSIQRYGAAGRERHALQHRCLLYAMPQVMENAIHPEVRRILLEAPEAVVLTWLISIDQRNLRYQKLRRQKVITQSDLEEEGEPSLDISIRIREGVANVVYHKLQAAKKSVQENPKLTHNQLFAVIDPIAHLCYQRILEKKKNLLDTQLEIFCGSSAEELLGRESHLLTTLPLPEPVGAFQTPAHEAKKWIRNLDWRSIALPLQAQLLEKVSRLSFIKRLPMTTAQPQLLLAQAASQMLPGLAYLALQSGAKADVVDRSGRSLLHTLIQSVDSPDLNQGDIIATAQVLLDDPHSNPNTRDAQELTPLFYLIGRAAPKLIRQLLDLFASKGADLELCNPLNDETLLDRAISLNKPADFMLLIASGAGARVKPGPALAFGKRHREIKGIRQALTRLERQSNRISWMLATRSLMLPKKPKRIALELEGTHAGKVFLRPKATSQLNLTKSGTFPKKEKGQFGRRTVIAINHEGYRLHFKENPEWPGVEHAVHTLHERIIGHGTPQSELFKTLDAKGSPYSILASQTIEGENFHDYLLRSDEISKKLTQLDLHRLHNFMLIAMLYNPEDLKPDNIIVAPFINHEGKESFQLISIDNDHAFVPPLTKGKLGRMQLQVKCILYCLDQMKEPLHPKTKELFLRLEPGSLIAGWLKELSAQDKRYSRLFNQEERRLLYKNLTVIPILFPPGSIANLFEKLTRLQRCLRNNPETPMSLLRQVIPELGVRYEEAFNHGETALSRFRHLTLTLYSTAIVGRFGTKINSRQILKSLRVPQQAVLKQSPKYSPSQALDELYQLAQQAKTIRHVRQELLSGNTKPFSQLLIGEFRDEVIAGINFSHVPHQERAILSALAATGASRRLVLKGCQALDDKLLSTLLSVSLSLTELRLRDCPKLTDASLKAAARACPYLEIVELTGSKKVCDVKGLKFPRLQALTLDGCRALEHLHLKSPRLTRLSLRGCYLLHQLSLSSGILEYAALDSCRSLPRKDIERLAEDSNALKRLVVKACPSIPEAHRELIQQCPPALLLEVGSKLWQHLPSVLDGSLKELNLERNQVGNQGAKAIGITLFTNNTLRILNLRAKHNPTNRIGVIGAEALGKGLIKNSALTRLDLKHNHIDTHGAKAIGAALKQNSVLTNLHLGNNKIGDQGVKAIGTALIVNHGLRILNLGRNRIGNQGATSIGIALFTNNTLTSLNLERNHIGDQSTRIIATGLTRNTTLLSLNLGRNHVGDRGVKAVATALSTNSTLHSLNLKAMHDPIHRIGNKGAAALAEVLITNSSLKSLQLEGNHIGDQGVKAFGKMLSTNSTLQSLRLKSHNLRIHKAGAEAAGMLLKGLSHNSSLTDLHLLCSDSVKLQTLRSIEAILTQNKRRRASQQPLQPAPESNLSSPMKGKESA